MSPKTSIALLVPLMLLEPAAGLGLTNEDDAGTGADAGDFFLEATRIAEGTVTGNFTLGDVHDYYRISLQAGSLVDFKAQSSNSNSNGVCAGLTLFTPNQTPWLSGGCEICTETNCVGQVSRIARVLIPWSGLWYVVVTTGISDEPTHLIRQPYALSITLLRSYHYVWVSPFVDQTWVAYKVPESAGPYFGALYYDASSHQAIDGDVVRKFVVTREKWFMSSQESGPYNSNYLGANLEYGGVRAGVGATIHARNRGLLDGPLWVSSSVPSSPSALLTYSNKPLNGWLVLGYDGEYQPNAVSGNDVIIRRLGQFNSEFSVVSPIASTVYRAASMVDLPTDFVGTFRLSPLSPLVSLLNSDIEHSSGGVVLPSGEVIEMNSTVSTSSHLVIVRPIPGDWVFFLNRDTGVHGNPILFDGVILPAGYLDFGE